MLNVFQYYDRRRKKMIRAADKRGHVEEKILLQSVVLLMLILVFGGCGEDSESKDVISIGADLPLSGECAPSSLTALNSVDLAIQMANEAGGLLGGKEIELIKMDNKTDGNVAAEIVEKLVEKGAVAILGGICSSETLGAAPKAAEKGVVLISGTSTNPTITNLNDEGYVFRTCPTDLDQGAVLADMAIKQNLKKVAIIFENTDYGQGLDEVFQKQFKSKGGTITSSQSIENGKTTYSDVAQKVVGENPEAIVLFMYPNEGSILLADTKKANYSGYYLSTDGLYDPALLQTEKEGVSLEKFIGVAFGAFQSDIYDAFETAYQSRYKSAPEMANSGFFDATMIVLLAIEAAGSVARDKIRDKIVEVSKDGNKVNIKDIKKALAKAAKEDIDYEGILGDVDLDANGDVIKSSFIQYQFESGQLVVKAKLE